MTDHGLMTDMVVVDKYGNRHHLRTELARGGQGAVYRTADADLAIKFPLSKGEIDRRADVADTFRHVRRLPLPERIPVSLPLAILRDHPGYVMRLLSEMSPYSAFYLDGQSRERLSGKMMPRWLAAVPDQAMALTLLHYAKSGSTKRRLIALAKCASILARLHAAGLVYGDISPNNCFVGDGPDPDVWLIDADNLRFEELRGGGVVYTPRYGAPEVVQRNASGYPLDRSRPRTDAWAFAVMAFESLSLVHPFIGRAVLDRDDGDDWADESTVGTSSMDPDDQAYAGLLPFVDDPKDDSNRALAGLPRKLVLTPPLARLFKETFSAGRLNPWRRPALDYWALELTRAYDLSLVCPECSMSYFKDSATCPYCDAPLPAFAVATTDRWEMVIQPAMSRVPLPRRLFHPFSCAHNAETEFEADVDFVTESATHVRGTAALPPSLSFRFAGVGR